MNKDFFWKLIERTRNESKGDFDAQCENIFTALLDHSSRQVVHWNQIYGLYRKVLCASRTWAELSSLDEDGSEAGLLDFSCKLLAQGREIYLQNISGVGDINLKREHPFEFSAYDAFNTLALRAFTMQNCYRDSCFTTLLQSFALYSQSHPLPVGIFLEIEKDLSDFCKSLRKKQLLNGQLIA